MKTPYLICMKDGEKMCSINILSFDSSNLYSKLPIYIKQGTTHPLAPCFIFIEFCHPGIKQILHAQPGIQLPF